MSLYSTVKIKLVSVFFFPPKKNDLHNLPCGCRTRLFPPYNTKTLFVAHPVYISYFLTRRQKGQCSYPTGTLLIECNQYILVILSAGPFFYLLAQKLISQVTFV